MYKNLEWLWKTENDFLMVERQTKRFPYVEDIDVLGDKGKMPPQICEYWSFIQRRALPILELATELDELRCLVFEAHGYAQKLKEEKCRMKASYHLFFPDVIVDGPRAKKIRNHTVQRFKEYTSKSTDPMFWLERAMTFGHMNGFEYNRWEAVFDKTCCNEGCGSRMPFSDKHADVIDKDRKTHIPNLGADGKPRQRKVIEGRRLMPVGEYIFYRDPTKPPKVIYSDERTPEEWMNEARIRVPDNTPYAIGGKDDSELKKRKQ